MPDYRYLIVGGGMTAFKQYRRSQIAEMRDIEEGETYESLRMSGVSIFDLGRNAGSPKAGDKVARNPKNHVYKWLVAAAYFADNFEPI